MTVPRIHLPGMTAEQWDEQPSLMGRAEMFPAHEWAKALKERELKMTISESIMKAAHEGIEAQPTVSDIEKAARAIVRRMGLDPAALGFSGPPRIAIGHLLVAPTAAEQRPLWTYFTRDAAAALNAVHK